MHIVAQSSDRLVVHDSPWPLRGVGAALAMGGSGLIAAIVASHHSGDQGAWVGFAVGGAFAAFGIAMLIMAADRRIIFDRVTKTAQLIQQGVLRQTTATEIPFGEIRDIALETSTFSTNGRANGGASYRAVFVLRDGSRLPWTSVLTSDFGTQANCVAAARTFGGWDAAAVRSGAGSSEIARPTPPPGVPVMPAGVGSIAAAFSGGVRPPAVQNVGCVLATLGIFAVVGAWLMVLQADRLAAWRPVPATVVSSDVIAVRGRKGGTSYRPVVVYTYQVAGRTYTSHAVTIITESRGWSWANGLIGRYPPGARTTAYVDPKNPASAYLVHELSFFPIVFVCIPLLFGGLVVLGIRRTTQQAALAAATPVPVLPAQGSAPPKAA